MQVFYHLRHSLSDFLRVFLSKNIKTDGFLLFAGSDFLAVYYLLLFSLPLTLIFLCRVF